MSRGLAAAWLTLTLALVVLAIAATRYTVHAPAAQPLVCVASVAAPLMVGCSNDRAYLREHGHWRDVGPLTPRALLPKG